MREERLKRFWFDNLEKTLELVKSNCPDDVKNSLAIADEVMQHKFTFRDTWEMEKTREAVHFGATVKDIVWDFKPKDDNEWIFAFSRQTFFAHLAKAYLYTGDLRYIRKFQDLILDWIKRCVRTEQSKGTYWRTLETGLRAENWLRAIKIVLVAKKEAIEDWGDLFNDEVMDTIDRSLEDHAGYLIENHTSFHCISNWGVLQAHGLFLLGLYFDKTEWIQLAIARLDHNLHNAVLSDGAQFEQSPMYHCEVLYCAQNAYLLAKKNKIELPIRLVRNVEKMFKALLTWTKPNGVLFCQSDSDAIFAGNLLVQGAMLFDNSKLLKRGQNRLYEANFWDFGEEALNMFQKLEAEESSSSALTESGNFLLLENGEKDSAYVRFHSGILGGGHGHADLLHLSCGLGEDDLLIDSGRYTYVENEIRLQLKRPAAHNTTLVNGRNFSEPLDSWIYGKVATFLPTKHVFTEKVDFVEAYHLGYFDQGVVCGRKVIFIKEAKLLLVLDLFHSNTKNRYEGRWHLGRNSLHSQGNSFSVEGENAKASLILDESCKFTVEKSPFSLEYNVLEEGQVISYQKESAGFCVMATLISLTKGEKTTELILKREDVKAASHDRVLSRDEAEAFVIQKDGKEYTLMVLYQSHNVPNDLLIANGYKAYASVCYFDEENPDGIILLH